HRRPDLVELLARLLVRLRQRSQQRAVLDDEQVLTQAVVQLRGNALTLTFLRFDQLPRKRLLRRLRPPHLSDAISPGQPHERYQARRNRCPEPPGLIEARQDDDGEGVSGRVPYPFTIVGGHVEGIRAGRKM